MTMRWNSVCSAEHDKSFYLYFSLDECPGNRQ